jgi:hypothetical protein
MKRNTFLDKVQRRYGKPESLCCGFWYISGKSDRSIGVIYCGFWRLIFLDVVAFGGAHQGVMAHLGRTILEKSFSFILGLKISQQRLAFIEQYDDSTHQTGEVRNECVIVAKRHQKFPSARGYGPFMVPSRCPCLAWRSLFDAVPFWPLLVPFALLAPFGPFWPLLPSWPLLGCYGPLGRLSAFYGHRVTTIIVQ